MKSGDNDNAEDFIFNSRSLAPNSTVVETGIVEESLIIVESTGDIIG